MQPSDQGQSIRYAEVKLHDKNLLSSRSPEEGSFNPIWRHPGREDLVEVPDKVCHLPSGEDQEEPRLRGNVHKEHNSSGSTVRKVANRLLVKRR